MRVLILCLLLLSSPAWAFPDSRCNNDGDPVPSFASGREPGTECLLIPDGLGNTIRFDSEADTGDEIDVQDCTTDDCAAVIWGFTYDDYTHAGVAGQDGNDAYPLNDHARFILIKDMVIGNTWFCNGGYWTGPTGSDASVYCAGGQGNSGHHTDAIQISATPTGTGAIVMQDSVIANSNHQIILIENVNGWGDPDTHPMFVWQGGFVGYVPALGVTSNWLQDCEDSGGEGGCGDTGRWQIGSNSSTHYARATWLINTHTNPTMPIAGYRVKTIVVVQGGMGGGCSNEDTPGLNTCTGIGYSPNGGFPAPFTDHYYSCGADCGNPVSAPDTANSCPNALIEDDLFPDDSQAELPLDEHVYCFTSLDAALVAGYNATTCPDCPLERPPFIQLSNTGWLDSDADGIPDFRDNCSAKATAIVCDTDQDGYGNACDADFDNNGTAKGGTDFGIYTMNVGLTAPPDNATDMNCDGYSGGGADFGLYTAAGTTPGPSGLACAGMIPCP